jgi:hypothetical protein
MSDQYVPALRRRFLEDELALTFLANPYKLWSSGNLTLQRTMLKLASTDRVPYDRKTHCLNPKKESPFNALTGIQYQNDINGAPKMRLNGVKYCLITTDYKFRQI